MNNRFISIMPTSTNIEMKEIIISSTKGTRLIHINDESWVDENGEFLIAENLRNYSQDIKDSAKELKNSITGKLVMVLINYSLALRECDAVIIGLVEKVIIEDEELVTSLILAPLIYHRMSVNRVEEIPDNRIYLNSYVLGLIEINRDEYTELINDYFKRKESLCENRVKFKY